MRYLPAIIMASVLFGIGCSPKVDVPAAAEPNSSGAIRPVGQKPASGVELDLSGRGLTKIPSDVFLRTDLVKLDLSDNDLSGAPQAEIRHLAKLKFLDLSKNNLTGLPAELGQLKELETLDVSDNQLTGLPMELGDLTQLRVLDISGNPYSTKDLDEIAKKLTQTEIRR